MPRILIIAAFMCVGLYLSAAAGEAAPAVPAAEADAWAKLSLHLWPGKAPGENDFGRMQGGLRIAARQIAPLQAAGHQALVAVMLENTTDHTIAMFGYDWCLTLKNADKPDSGTTRSVGHEPYAGAAASLPAKGRIVAIMEARRSENLAGAQQALLTVNMPTLDKLADFTKHPLYLEHGDLVSAPFPITWSDEPPAELTQAVATAKGLLKGGKAEDHKGDLLAKAFLWLLAADRNHEQSISSALISHPEWQVDLAMLACASLDGPWGKDYAGVNKFSWAMVEQAKSTGTPLRVSVAYAFGRQGFENGNETPNMHALSDTFAAILAQQGRMQEAIAVQRIAYQATPKGDQQYEDIGSRMVDFAAMALMPRDQRPPLFTSEGFKGDAVLAYLRTAAHDKDPVMAARAKKLLTDSFGEKAGNMKEDF